MKVPAGKPDALCLSPKIRMMEAENADCYKYAVPGHTHTRDEGRKKETERINIVKMFLRTYITSVYHNLK